MESVGKEAIFKEKTLTTMPKSVLCQKTWKDGRSAWVAREGVGSSTKGKEHRLLFQWSEKGRFTEERLCS